MATVLTNSIDGNKFNYKHTVTAGDVTDGEVIIDFRVSPDIVAVIDLLDANGKQVDKSDAIQSYPANGQVRFGANFITTFALANSLKTITNAHAADAVEHGTAADAVNFPVVADAAIDLTSLFALTGALLTAYDAHDTDAELASGWAFHNAQETGDHSLVSAVAPVSLTEAITKLNDLKAKYNAHDADATAHTTGSTHQEATADAVSTLALIAGEVITVVGGINPVGYLG